MISKYINQEDGAITALNLFLFAGSCMLMGLSLDVANAYKVRTELQIAADTTSHAALYNRSTMSSADAIESAIALAAYNLGLPDQNEAVKTSDVSFGIWNDATRTFAPDPTSKSAVRVSVTRSSARTNPVGTFLLKFIGMNSWDVTAQSVSATYRPPCLNEGFVADEVVDVQSNNGFYNGFCLHSNDHISVNQNNFFEAGTVVSMPNTDDLDLPASGFTKNEGLAAALRDAFYQVRIVDRIPAIIASLRAGDPSYMPDYINNRNPVIVSGGTLDASNFPKNRVYILSCNSGNKVTIQNNAVLDTVVIIAQCPVTFGQGVVLQDVIFANTSTDSQSFSSPSGFQIGKDDNCAAGGGAQLLTMGGVRFASKMQTYGGQIIAMGDVDFAAQGDGIEGTSIVAGGQIDSTSNMTMGLCGSGMEDNFELDYYRVAG